MKVLVTGSSGFLGSFVAKELLAQGHAARALLRKGELPPGLLGLPIEVAKGDILDPPSVERALLGCDAVIHSAAKVSFRKIEREEIYRTNVDGTRVVLEAALRAKVQRVVYTSSVATMGASLTPELLDETAPWGQKHTGSPYHLSKWEAEQEALRLASQGLPVVLLAPGVLLGPDDLKLTSTRLVMHCLNRTIPGYVDGGFSVSNVRDCARAHVAALTRGRVGERYIVAGLNSTAREFFALVAELSGVPAPRRLPAAVLFAVVALADGLVTLVPPLGRTTLGEVNLPTYRSSRQYTLYRCAKAETELGYTMSTLEQTLVETIGSLVFRGVVPARTPKLQGLAARLTPGAG